MSNTLPYADLHLHTIYSDGSMQPYEVLQYAEKYKFKAVSITDHDTVSGIEESIKEGKRLNIEVISGIELSAVVEEEEIHILGYCIDWQDSRFLNELARLKVKRENRIKKMLAHLERLNIKINIDELINFAGSGTIGRLHLAHFLCNKGIVDTVYEAFDKYIGKHKPAYERVNALTVKEAIELIIKYGGIPVYAHPALNRMDSIIPSMIEYGLGGIEVYHSSQSKKELETYMALAEENGLLVTGGSDCHGKGKLNILIGKVKLPYYYVEMLKTMT